MTASEAVPCTTQQTVLGEGSRWDGRRDELLGVDIVSGHVYRETIADDGMLTRVRQYELPGTVGAIAPIEGDEGFLLAADLGFAYLSLDGAVVPLADVSPQGTRME